MLYNAPSHPSTPQHNIHNCTSQHTLHRHQRVIVRVLAYGLQPVKGEMNETKRVEEVVYM